MAEKKSKPEATEKKTAPKTSEAKKPVAKTQATEKKVAAKPENKTVKPAQKATPAASAKKPTETKPAAAPAAKAQPKAPKATAETKADEPKPAVKEAKTEKPAKTSKTEKQPKQPKNTDKVKNSGGIAALFKDTKIRIIAIVTAAVLLLGIILGIVFGAKSCNATVDNGALSNVVIPIPNNNNYLLGSKVKPNEPYEETSAGKETLYNTNQIKTYEYDTDKKTNTAVSYSAQVIGTVERKIPQTVRDEGLAAYPKFGYTLTTVIGTDNNSVAARNALIRESSYLTATGTWNAGGGGYTWMDKDGLLYSGTTAEPVQTLDKSGHHRRLYKHTAANGLYMGNVSDDEPAIVKSVTMSPRDYTRGYNVTGVYAPAGEVIKIQLSEADMNATGGIVIHIGQALYNGKANNIWTAKNQMQRIPHLLNTMTVDKNTSVYDEQTHTYTAYVGSFIGGPVYIRNESVTFSATISGGVAYSHFILGYTSEKEFNENAKSSAPYFDLEVWDNGVLHSGPKAYAQDLTYDDIYKAAVLWDKVASVTTTGSRQGIVFLYDPFVAAGAAVAFPGQGSVNCPSGWMGASLNYNAIVSSGSWGNFHEYHHNFQGYGVGAGGEVTNNGMTLVSYALFTKISAKRGISNFGAQGLGGWNNYTSAPWALEETNKIARANENPSNGDQGLALYATLLHNFGPDAYIQAKVAGGGQSYKAYMNAWQNVTHNNMYYYFNDILKGTDLTNDADSSYPMFVPASCVYQTGRSYVYDGQKKDITTMQPYVIPYGQKFTIDLRKYTTNNGQYSNGSIVVPDGCSFTVKEVGQPEHGSIASNGDGTYVYTPDANEMLSGKIRVKLSVTHSKYTFDDVELILGFEQSHETNKMTLERTTYTYTADTMYSDAQEAYESGFAGYTDKEDWDHSNPTQNCNTDIWFCTEATASKFPNADPEKHFVKDNTIEEIKGKLYFQDEGKYRIFLRGRTNCAVYYSVDGGETYTLGAKVTNGTGSAFYLNDDETYFDLELEANSWVYFKEVLIVQSTPAASYIGLGTAQWQTPMFTMVEDENGVTHYYDYKGIEVTEEQANSSELVPPTSASYVNAYRCSYEFPDNGSFETDYFYTRSYKYNYTDNKLLGEGQRVVEQQCANLDLHTGWGGNNLSVILDGVKDQGGGMQLHTSGGIKADKPFTLVVDLGKTYSANRLVIYSQAGRADPCFPKALNLYASTDGHNYELVKSYTDLTFSGNKQTLDFDMTEMRYYKIEVSEATSGHLIIRELEMWNTFELNGGNKIAPDNEAFAYGDGWKAVSAHSSFGHVYVGSANATMTFAFNGTRLALLSSEAFGKNFEVTIDGKKMTSIELKAISDSYGASFISELLEDKEHTVTIKCLGEANIDSIVIYQ